MNGEMLSRGRAQFMKESENWPRQCSRLYCWGGGQLVDKLIMRPSEECRHAREGGGKGRMEEKG